MSANPSPLNGLDQTMTDRNARPDRNGPVEHETIVAKQARTRDVPPRDDRVEVEDVGVSANEPVHYERDVDAIPPRRDRGEDLGPGDPVRFDENRDAVPPRETESPVRAPVVATAMFLPVVILSIIALILIIWFLAF